MRKISIFISLALLLCSRFLASEDEKVIIKFDHLVGEMTLNKQDKLVFKTNEKVGEHERRFIAVAKKPMAMVKDLKGKKVKLKKVNIIEKEKFSMIVYLKSAEVIE
jgi:hypothetical protein